MSDFAARFGFAAAVAVASLSVRLAVAPDELKVTANDNRIPAGSMHHDTLEIRLVLQRAQWYPEAEDGPHVLVEAFGEEGKIPSIPAPLIRVREGTVIHATIRNTLTDSTAQIIGLGSHPIAARDTIHLAPGATTETTFLAGAPGTYLYRANIGKQGSVRGDPEHTTAGGGFIVDPQGGSPPDRVFVMNIINYDIDSTHTKEALGINGKSWPYTERINTTVGDSIRWRVINSTIRGHPMHMHGFYFRTTAIGTGIASKPITGKEQFLQVTDSYAPWSTRDLAWSPDRPGNWLFHCHITFHVIPDARLDHGPVNEPETHSPDPMQHMAGLVLGLKVSPRPNARPTKLPKPVHYDMFMNQGAPRKLMPVTYSYIVQRGATPPAADSILIPGTTLVLTKGQPVDITVHNRSDQHAGVHWHGVELESWSDGVMGWSSKGSAVAPSIPPGGSFTAHLLLPRAGTFIYHTHMNDIEQVTGGAVGAIVVMEPGEKFDPTRDHIYLTHWNGPDGFPLVNGDSGTSAPLMLSTGSVHRFRFINIGPANRYRFSIRQDSTVAKWHPRAKDGADLSAALRGEVPASFVIDVGETYDFDYTAPSQPGTYELVLTTPNGQLTGWRQKLVVR